MPRKAKKRGFRGAKPLQISKRSNQISSFADMPTDVFLKVCSYLTLKEICKIGGVCLRWYQLTRCELLWHLIDIPGLGLTLENSNKLLSILPSCVEHLRVGSPDSESQRKSLPAPMYELGTRFPKLKTLIIQNAFVVKPFLSHEIVSGFVLNCKVPQRYQVLKYYDVVKYADGEPGVGLNALHCVFPNLSVLSLRRSVVAMEDFFPSKRTYGFPPSNIRVLDLTFCKSITDEAASSLARLPNLEELYLTETAITVNGVLAVLMSLPNLRVLDLEKTVVCHETFSILQKYGHFLTHIYMGETALTDACIMNVDRGAFPRLQKFCLAHTLVTDAGIQKLLDSVISLTCVDVTGSCVSAGCLANRCETVGEKLQWDESEKGSCCNHFLKKHYRGGFKNRFYL